MHGRRDEDIYGCTGWGYADLLPYVRRAEDQQRGESRHRGPLRVEDQRDEHPLSQAWREAVELHLADAFRQVGQAAQGARDTDPVEAVKACEGETATQLTWLKNRMKQAAPQALVVAR